MSVEERLSHLEGLLLDQRGDYLPPSGDPSRLSEEWSEALGKGPSDVGDTTGGYEPHSTQKTPATVLANIPTDADLEDPKSIFWDPYGIVEQLAYKEKPSAITYQTLDTMVWKMPILNGIIQTRVNQVATFTKPQRHRFDTGFRIRLRDPEERPTRVAKKAIRELEQFVLTSGAVEDLRTRDSFEIFIRKIIRDSLTYDQCCWEMIEDRRGRPSAWYAVDAATIRLADTAHLYPETNLDRVKNVQIYDEIVVNEYTGREMVFAVRNPRTNVRSQGYGTGEIEMLVSVITALLFGFDYNRNIFSQGTMQKGLLNLKGAIPEKQLRAFRRQWFELVSGTSNAHRLPILNAEDVQWVGMQSSNKDMEFGAWMDFLIKVSTSLFLMDPAEVNFRYGNSGQKSMFESSNKSKLVESKDKGLKPLLRFFADKIDRHIIWPLNPDFQFEFVGLESMTPKELADLNTQRVRTMYTVDELRAENDLEPLPEGTGKVLLDPNWMLDKGRKEQMELQQTQFAVQSATQPQPQPQLQIPEPAAAPAGAVPKPKGASSPVSTAASKSLVLEGSV